MKTIRVLLIIIMITISPNIFSQKIYEGNGFNHKQLLILNTDKTYEYKSMERGCMDSSTTLIEEKGFFLMQQNSLDLIPEFRSYSTLPLEDSLIIKDSSLNLKKSITKTEKFNKNTIVKKIFSIIKYGHYEFLMENNGLNAEEINNQFLEFSNKINQENFLETKLSIIDKLHIVQNTQINNNQFLRTIPKNFQNYFYKKPNKLQIVSYIENKYRDPGIIPEAPDNIAMIYDYKIELNKGMSDGVHIGMVVYTQNHINNCNTDAVISKVEKKSSTAIILGGPKCNLTDNYFSTKFKKE